MSTMFDRFTDDARTSMGRAREAALSWNHDWIGTEHVLLGLCRVEDSVARAILGSLGIPPETVQREVEQKMRRGESMVTSGQLPFTPRAKKVLELSLAEALGLRHAYIGTEHLLLALIRAREGVGGAVLRKLGLDVAKVRDEVPRLVETHRRDGDAVPEGAVGLLSQRLDDIEQLARTLLDEVVRLRRDLDDRES